MPLDPKDPVVQQMLGYFDGIVKRIDFDLAPTLHGLSTPAAVDVKALAMALAPLLPAGTDPQAVADKVLATLKAKL